MKKWNVFVYTLFFITIGQSCNNGRENSEAFTKLETLLPDEGLEKLGAVVVVPLENACSSCSMSALQQLSMVDEKYKGMIQLVLTAKSFKLIDHVMEEVDLTGFQLHKDGNYTFWKHQLVLNSPSFYFIDGDAVVEEGTVSVPVFNLFFPFRRVNYLWCNHITPFLNS